MHSIADLQHNKQHTITAISNKAYLNIQPMSKFSIIFLSNLIFITAAWATEQNNSNQTITSAPSLHTLNRLEHTNLNTEDYVWKIELIADPEHKGISHKLLNPNPKFPMLDQRALELAQNYRYEELEKLKQMSLEQYESSMKNTVQPTTSYILNIQFPLGIAWKKQPRFQRLAEISAKFCKLREDDPFYEQAVIRKDRSYIFKTKLFVNSNGVVNTVNLLNPSSDTTLNNLVYKELISSQFHPYNENGIPTHFEAEQPIQLVCPQR